MPAEPARDALTKPWREVFAGREHEMSVLRDAWAAAARGEPQLVAVIAESGFGKTRLAQEFFNWLSTHEDGIAGAGYWPDKLGWVGDNLRVNPELAECRPEHPMPFLWWGLRCPDPGARNQLTIDALGAHLPDLVPHLEPMLKARAATAVNEQWKNLAVKAGFALAGFVPFVGGAVSMAKDAIELVRDVRALPDPGADTGPSARDRLAAEHHRSLVDSVLEDLSQLLADAPGRRRIPAVLLVDDVHWAGSEPALMELLGRLLQRAFTERWPLLLLLTSWAKEWAEQRRVAGATVPRLVLDRLGEDGESWVELHLDRAPDLSAVVAAALPGLDRRKRQAVLAKVDGNPRLLDEIVLALRRRRGLFVGRDPDGDLTEDGLREVVGLTYKLHDLVRDRLDTAPEAMRRALSLASMQSVQFTARLTEEVAEALAAGPAAAALREAEDPWCLVRGVDLDLAEFVQRVYHEVAAEQLADLTDPHAAREALVAVLHRRLSDTGSFVAMPVREQEHSLVIAANLLTEPDRPPGDRAAGASALLRLTAAALARFDFATAHAIAGRYVDGEAAGRWAFSDASLWEIDQARRALETMGDWPPADRICSHQLARTRSALAAHPDDLGCRRDLSVSLNNVAGAALRRGDLAAAERLYGESLEVRRGLASELGTPEARRDLSIAYERIAALREEQGEPAAALAAWRQALTISEALASEFPGDVELLTTPVVHLVRMAVLRADDGEPGRAEAHLLLRQAQAILAPLAEAGQLDNDRLNWMAMIEGQLDRLGQGE